MSETVNALRKRLLAAYRATSMIRADAVTAAVEFMDDKVKYRHVMEALAEIENAQAGIHNALGSLGCAMMNGNPASSLGEAIVNALTGGSVSKLEGGNVKAIDPVEDEAPTGKPQTLVTPQEQPVDPAPLPEPAPAEATAAAAAVQGDDDIPLPPSA